MKKFIQLLTTALFIFSFNSYALECKNLNETQAQKAKRLLKEYFDKELFVIDEYCESCFDKYPKPIVVEKFQVEKKNKKYNLIINGKSIDITHLYVNGRNLASFAGCETVAVSKFLD